MELFINWTKSVANVTPESHIAIDGKAVRASAKKSAGGRVPYIVSAFLVGNGISIGQKIVDDKINEITVLLTAQKQS